MTKLPPDMEALRAQLLSDFDDIEAPSGIIARRRAPQTAVHPEAEARLCDYECDDRTRSILELHAAGLKNRAIARKLKRKRDTVNAVVKRYRLWLAGELDTRNGRPAVHGRTRGCLLVGARLADGMEAEAFFFVQEHVRASDPSATRGDVLRSAIRMAANVISVNKTRGAK